MASMKADYELRQVTGSSSVLRLVRALAGLHEPETIRRVKEALRFSAERVTRSLIEGLDSPVERERAIALDLLAALGDLSAVAALERKLEEPACDNAIALDEAIRRIRQRHTLWRG
jgi:hypothetical protein